MRNVSDTLLNVDHKELMHEEGLQPSTGKVYLISWEVRLKSSGLAEAMLYNAKITLLPF